MTTKTSLKAGDLVRAPWGLDEVVGVVLDMYGPVARPSVLVEVRIPGASGETLDVTTVSFPASALEVISESRKGLET